MRTERLQVRNFIDGEFVEPIPFLSFRAKSRNGASGASDIDGCAARVAARESGDERVNLSLFGKAFTMPLKLSDKKLAVLGAGKLGGILLRAYLKHRLFVSGRVTA